MTTSANAEPSIITLEPRLTAVVRAVIQVADVESFYDRSFGLIAETIARQDAGFGGAAFGLYHAVPSETMDLEVGMPTMKPIVAEGEVTLSQLPGGRAGKYVYHGGYDGMGEAWEYFIGWLSTHGHPLGLPMWEVYVTEPNPDMNPDDLVTELYCLLGDADG